MKNYIDNENSMRIFAVPSRVLIFSIEQLRASLNSFQL